MKPHPKVSPKKYPGVSPPKEADAPAKTRWRIKGSADEGHVYQGQQIVNSCRTCGNGK